MKKTMTRQELVEDFQHFLDTHAEEVKAHICQPPYDFMDDDDWEDGESEMTKGFDHYKDIDWDRLFLLPSICIESNNVFGYMGMVGKTDVTEIRFDFLGFHLTLYFWRREQTNEKDRNWTR